MVRMCFILLFLPSLPLQAQSPFSLDSAAVHLRTLAVEIGPRPMGSPAEQRAMEYALQNFRSYGLDEVYLLRFDRALVRPGPRRVNTNSGVAVGVLRGTSDRSIVIGAHIDSADPNIPGANDNASGSAVVLELARVLAQRENESTLVFALFGGEEQGLLGSYHFVNHFPELDRVVLMLQVDMANGSEWLVPLIDSRSGSAPSWLVRAAYEELSAAGHTGLSYPTHFMTLNSAFPGGIGSDHIPFLERGIPAIDFTSDINEPIHTPQDSYENFRPEGLKRSGDLVYRLVERFDGGVPSSPLSAEGDNASGRGALEEYFLIEILGSPVFFPLWSLHAFNIAAFCIALIVLLLHRRRRESQLAPEEVRFGDRRTIPGLKLFLLMFIIQACVWVSVDVVGLLKGTRVPWWSDPSGYVLLGGLGGVFGIWLALQVAGRLRLSSDAFRYHLRAAVMLIFLLGLFSLVSPKLAFYPAWTVFFLSLALASRSAALRLILWLISAHFMYRLVFNEGFGLMVRTIGQMPGTTLPSFISTLAVTLFFSLWAFPFLLGFAALWFDGRHDILWLKSFRRPVGAVLSGASVFICLLGLAMRPTYSDVWKQQIRIDEVWDLDSGRVEVTARSNDVLRGLRVKLFERDTLIESSERVAVLYRGEQHLPSSMDVQRSVRREADATDSTTALDILLSLRMHQRPYTLTVRYEVESGNAVSAASPFALNEREKDVTLSWYSFSDSIASIPVRLRVNQGSMIRERIEALFARPLAVAHAEKESASITFRAAIRLSTELYEKTKPE